MSRINPNNCSIDCFFHSERHPGFIIFKIVASQKVDINHAHVSVNIFQYHASKTNSTIKTYYLFSA